MAAGIPVVAAKAEGPFEEIIENGVDGILVGSRDPCLIADVIVQLLNGQAAQGWHGCGCERKGEV